MTGGRIPSARRKSDNEEFTEDNEHIFLILHMTTYNEEEAGERSCFQGNSGRYGHPSGRRISAKRKRSETNGRMNE